MDEILLNEFLRDITTTLIGVFAGGLLTIWVNSISERKKIKREVEIKTLEKLLPLLEKTAIDIGVAGTYILTLEDVRHYKRDIENYVSFREISNIFTSNMYILFPFYDRFKKINFERIKIMSTFKEEKEKLYKIAEKHNEYEVKKLLELDNELKIFREENSKKYTNLIKDICYLSNDINQHYLYDIFKTNNIKRNIDCHKINKKDKRRKRT